MEKKPILSNAFGIAVIAAIVGGLFTVVPTAYDWFKNRELLIYDVSTSGVLESTSDKQIYFVTVSNGGSTEVETIEIRYNFENSEITDFSMDLPFGVDVTELEKSSNVSLVIDRLNPDEAIKFAFLADGDVRDENQDIEIRAKGIPAEKIVPLNERSDLLWFGGNSAAELMAMIATALTLFSFLLFKSKSALVASVPEREPDRPIILRYISLISGFGYSSHVALSDEISFASFGDEAYFAVKNGALEAEVGARIIGALLRCQMAPSSAHGLKRHLRLMLGDQADDFLREIQKKTTDIRSDIERIFEINIPKMPNEAPTPKAEVV